ncbi:MAG: trypsin-like peptidase domain-containing protein [Kiritimatiellia bacterium]
MKQYIRLCVATIFIVLRTATAAQSTQATPDISEAMPSIFKVHAVTYRYDYQQPWQAGGSTSGSGSAFLIEGGLLLTCGHVVADAISLELQPQGSAARHTAFVRHISYDSDLAILELEDPSVLEGLPTLKLENHTSQLGDEVFAVGFPMGGTRLSLTRGIVSRIDHNVYAFSGVDQRLVMQIDAAINPGNSGGPVVNSENRVVGVAFQGIRGGQGLGYAVPVPVIRHFLDDTQNLPYHGVPNLHVQTFELRNPTLRENLGLDPTGTTGVVVTEVSAFCASFGHIHPGDVLLAIEGVPIQQDGSIVLNNNNLPFWELVERKQWGDTLQLDVLRDTETLTITFPLNAEPHPFLFRQIYDRAPEYLMTGGLCFVPLSRNHIVTLGNTSSDSLIPVFYYAQRVLFDTDVANHKQLITLASILPHPVNTYANQFQHQIIHRINEQEILHLNDIKRALETPIDGFHIFEFKAHNMPFFLEASTLADANQQIQARYGVTQLYAIETEQPAGTTTSQAATR